MFNANVFILVFIILIMEFEVIIKYLVWIALFGIALAGVYAMLKRLGVL